MGAVLAFSLWWGPGSKRLRVPVRKLVVRTTSRPWLGWLGILAVGVLVALAGYTLVTTGTGVGPAAGPALARGHPARRPAQLPLTRSSAAVRTSRSGSPGSRDAVPTCGRLWQTRGRAACGTIIS